jgi:dihydropteroate synthase
MLRVELFSKQKAARNSCHLSGTRENRLLNARFSAKLPAMLTLEYLAELVDKNRAALNAPVRSFSIGNRQFAFDSEPAIMGVVNLSPDSWYRESVCLTTEMALRRARVLQAQGAALIDIGAESSLAHAQRVDATAQSSRLLPVVRELAAEGALVSVETYNATVARLCLEAGAKVLNLTGIDASGEIFKMAAEHSAAVILCHVQGENVREVVDLDLGVNPVEALRAFFERQTDLALSQGLERVFIDPGLGFYYPNLQDSATRVRHQMQIFLNTFRLRPLGFPICHALPHAFEYFGEEVRGAESFFCVLAALGGTGLFRTHEVPRIRAVLNTLHCF